MTIQKLFLILASCCLLLACGAEAEPESMSGTTVSADLLAAADNAGLTLPDGFAAVLVADSVGFIRHIAVNSNGDIYAMLRRPKDGMGIAAIRDTNGDGQADTTAYFGDIFGTGVSIYDNHLYAASDTHVVRYKLDGNLVPSGDPQTIAGGFVFERQHASKNMAFDKAGNMYVNVGAPSNACQEKDREAGNPGMDPCPLLEKYAGIWRFDAAKPNQHQMRDGYRYATGIRNALALDWNQQTDKLYLVQHGRDQFDVMWPELFDQQYNADMPSEEFFVVEDGSDCGWPYCYYDHIKEKKLLSPEYGGDGSIECPHSQCLNPIVAFPAHYAPNGMAFYDGDQFPQHYRNGAFITFHGSWNRAPFYQKGYQVAFVPFKEGKPTGDWQVFADGFAGSDTLRSPRQARYRPMGIADGSDGSLYVSDSRVGRIWRIIYRG